MKNLSAALFSLLVLGMIHVDRAQNGDNSQDLGVVAKSAVTDSTPAGNSLKAQKYYDSGVHFYEAGKLSEAIQSFKVALQLRPDDAQTYYMLGMAQSKSNAYKESFESFKRAARLKADWPEAHFRMGVMAYVLGKKSQSSDAHQNLSRLNSPLANTLNRIIKEENKTKVAEGLGAGNWSMKQPEAPSATAKTPTANTASETIESRPSSVAEDPTPTGIYKVGVGDVLDVRLLNSTTPRSTLYTVIDGGLIDLAIAGGPIAVAGLTTEEIQGRIAEELKRRAVEEGARVSVGVRQYASHSVIITGLVNNPGAKFLRREAVPLYVIMAEAQARLDAGKVAIMRSGLPGAVLDLGDPVALNFMIRSGDVISVTSRPQEFYYIAGRINHPGQKAYQPGITLLQAILAAGGLTQQSNNLVELSREGQDGRLATTTFKLKEIKAGKIQDPRLQPGDRIEVVR
ncbi:MAG: tetratricopeptide repeat protein [Pyrinomonadaceae bacterium]